MSTMSPCNKMADSECPAPSSRDTSRGCSHHPMTSMSTSRITCRRHSPLPKVCGLQIVLVVLLACVCLCSGNKFSNYVPCAKCDPSRCPQLAYCEGESVKDHCGCCTVCTSSRFQPHMVVAKPAGGNACDQVKCPKFKVCVENVQGVPLCKCPSDFVCRRNKNVKKREVCGTDGKTYPSRCHMRIASCNQGVAVRKKYRGECSEEDGEKDAAKYNRRLKRLWRRRRQRNRKANEAAAEKGGGKPKKASKGKKKQRRRRRRKSGNRLGKGKSRSRRHRGSAGIAKNPATRSFEEAFAQYTWKA